MAAKRRWSEWPGKFVSELNGTSGLAGFGGALLTGLSFGGLTAASGALAVITGGVGIVIMGGAVLVAGAKSLPPKLIHPSDVVGQDQTIEDLVKIDPKPFAVGIVGPSQAGKSTLARRILQQPQPAKVPRTQGVHCHVAALQTAPLTYVAMVDGPGNQYAMQFSVVEHSQIAFVLLDHNSGDGAAHIDTNRVKDHQHFQEQLRHYLVAKGQKLRWVHIILNKQDLWHQVDHQNLLRFLEDETKQWRNSNLSMRVTSSVHSNESPADIASLLSEIKTFVASHKP